MDLEHELKYSTVSSSSNTAYHFDTVLSYWMYFDIHIHAHSDFFTILRKFPTSDKIFKQYIKVVFESGCCSLLKNGLWIL